MIKEVYLAGGCFWGVEAYFMQIKGVLETQVGYTNGTTKDTNYKSIKETDHTEVVYIKYDSDIISFNDILKHYFRIIDPTSINKQGPDEGRQYRTGIYYVDNETFLEADSYIKTLQKEFDNKIVVELDKVNNYICAEEYHQKYLKNNPLGYCHIDLSLAKKEL